LRRNNPECWIASSEYLLAMTPCLSYGKVTVLLFRVTDPWLLNNLL